MRNNHRLTYTVTLQNFKKVEVFFTRSLIEVNAQSTVSAVNKTVKSKNHL